ncbi:hypothetical protein ACHAWF_008787 [Thalassiosira exigua]
MTIFAKKRSNSSSASSEFKRGDTLESFPSINASTHDSLLGANSFLLDSSPSPWNSIPSTSRRDSQRETLGRVLRKDTSKECNQGADHMDEETKQMLNLTLGELKKKAKEKAKEEALSKRKLPTSHPKSCARGAGGGGGIPKKRDPDAPKPKRSAYVLYSNHLKAELCAKENAEANASAKEISQLIAKKFKALTPAERAVWEEKAAADKKRYEKEMEEYAGKRNAAGGASTKDMTLGELMKQQSKKSGPWYTAV